MEILIGNESKVRYAVDIGDLEVKGWSIIEEMSTTPHKLSVCIVNVRPDLTRLIECCRQATTKVAVGCCEPVARCDRLGLVDGYVKAWSSDVRSLLTMSASELL